LRLGGRLKPRAFRRGPFFGNEFRKHFVLGNAVGRAPGSDSENCDENCARRAARGSNIAPDAPRAARPGRKPNLPEGIPGAAPSAPPGLRMRSRTPPGVTPGAPPRLAPSERAVNSGLGISLGDAPRGGSGGGPEDSHGAEPATRAGVAKAQGTPPGALWAPPESGSGRARENCSRLAGSPGSASRAVAAAAGQARSG
jgi:hypothetical protein